MKTPQILGLCGSLREGSYTRQALGRVLEVAEAAGASCRMLAAESLQLPLCDGRGEDALPPAVQELRTAAREASAFVFGSPEYCGTFSAVIKNAVEWLGPELLEGKAAGVVTVAEGGSADGSLTALRELLLREGAWVVPIPAALPMVSQVFAQREVPFSRKLFSNLDALGQALPQAIQRLGNGRG